MVPIQTALLSVSDKTGLDRFAAGLHARGVVLLSTGGTAESLRHQGLPVQEVGALTGFGERFDGRVKTLHPAVHAGILARRGMPGDMATLAESGWRPIDLVVVNLYPFAATVAAGASVPESLEQIDIGGPAMLRAAAKNHADVVAVVDPTDYEGVLAELARDGGISLATRLVLAQKVFQHTAAYDRQVALYLDRLSVGPGGAMTIRPAEALPPTLAPLMRQACGLRYGENPHQAGGLYVPAAEPARGWAAAVQLQGKELSYNNYLDMDAAWRLVNEYPECACAIVKHNNPCGLAVAADPAEAYRRALAVDPDSAFGSVIAFNRSLSEACARELADLFVEVVVAPRFDAPGLDVLKRKKNLRLVQRGVDQPTDPGLDIRSIDGAWLAQRDRPDAPPEPRVVTVRPPEPAELADLMFGWRAVKHVRSNAIVIASGGRLLGVGAGQMSRIDAARLAVTKCRVAPAGAVAASDAFLPFPDTLEVAVAAGIRALIQPGGSIRDEEVIAAANRHGVAMLFTGVRHFRH